MQKSDGPVRRRGPLLDLAAQPAHLPAFLRIARALTSAIEAGRLSPGVRLSGSRTLARELAVHRNTVLAAFAELIAEGFLVTEPGRGTFVATSLKAPAKGTRRAAPQRGMPARPAYPFETCELPAQTFVPAGAIALFGGLPDVSLVPRAAYARAYRRALVGTRADVLLYGDPYGEHALRCALAAMLRRDRGLAIEADDVLITRGSQMAMYLLGQVLLGPDDNVAVEALGYPPAHRALSARGARLLPIALDSQGLRVDLLAELCAHTRLRAVYVTPHHQYPSTVTMSPARRLALLALARQHQFAVIEDDYDHEFHYEGRPVLPLGSRDLGSVIYVGTLSKVFAPALRLGFLVAPRPLLARAAALRFDIDRQGDRIAERALAELLEDGELARHLLRARACYTARRDHAVRALTAQLDGVLRFDAPRGGMALWAEVCAPFDAHDLVARAEARGVFMQRGDVFSLAGPTHHVRIGFGGVTEATFAQAVALIAQAASPSRRNRGAGATKSRKRL